MNNNFIKVDKVYRLCDYMLDMCRFFIIMLVLWSHVFALEFSSPAAAESFQQGGDVRSLPSDRELALHILKGKGKDIKFAARSSGCSVRCSTGCSKACSTSCSTSCSTRCKTSPSVYVPTTSYPKVTTSRRGTFSVSAYDDDEEKTEKEQQPKKDIYWEDSEKSLVHNMSCKLFAVGSGKPKLKSKLPDCQQCGGQSKKPFEKGRVRIIAED